MGMLCVVFSLIMVCVSLCVCIGDFMKVLELILMLSISVFVFLVSFLFIIELVINGSDLMVLVMLCSVYSLVLVGVSWLVVKIVVLML